MPVISERVASIVHMTIADMADLADARPGSFRLEDADAIIPPALVAEFVRGLGR